MSSTLQSRMSAVFIWHVAVGLCPSWIYCGQVLGMEQRSLGLLLEAYCGMHTDKSFQKADWRVRWASHPDSDLLFGC